MLQDSKRDMLKRNINMQHIYVTYSCKDRPIVIERSYNTKHT